MLAFHNGPRSVLLASGPRMRNVCCMLLTRSLS